LALAQKLKENSSGFNICSIFEQTDPAAGQHQKHYDSIPFKTLKELKHTCTMCGAAGPFTHFLSSITTGSAVPPDDWMAITKACLGPRDYLLRKTSYNELWKEKAMHNTAYGVPITADMLLGQGDYTGLQNQLNYLPLTYEQLAMATTQV
jgi:hypothetical protein